MNYIGGKYRILNQILPLFPDNINCFLDLFAGGCNVAVNVSANRIICNDILFYIIDLYTYFKNTNIDILLKEIDRIIEFYSLSLTNEQGYKTLREDYNKTKNPLLFFALICYSFNHQIRYNNSHMFTTPFGKERSRYNDTIKNNLIRFVESIQNKHVELSSLNFKQFDYSFLTPQDFVYCDPPYLITVGSYNDGKRGFEGWSAKEESTLLNLLDELNDKNIKFALSNVLYHKGKVNEILLEWVNKRKYNIHYLSMNYSNSSYHSANTNDTSSVEVLITNYDKKQ